MPLSGRRFPFSLNAFRVCLATSLSFQLIPFDSALFSRALCASSSGDVCYALFTLLYERILARFKLIFFDLPASIQTPPSRHPAETQVTFGGKLPPPPHFLLAKVGAGVLYFWSDNYSPLPLTKSSRFEQFCPPNPTDAALWVFFFKAVTFSLACQASSFFVCLPPLH